MLHTFCLMFNVKLNPQNLKNSALLQVVTKSKTVRYRLGYCYTYSVSVLSVLTGLWLHTVTSHSLCVI